MRKAAIGFILCLIMVLNVAGVSGEYYPCGAVRANVNIMVQGSIVTPEREIVGISGRILVPARTVFSAIGVKVDWFEQSQTVVLTRGAMRVAMVIGSRYATVNYRQELSDVPPILIRGTVMVPVRYVAEALGMEVRWLGESGTVSIADKSGQAVAPSTDSISRGNGRNYVVVIDAGHGGKDPGAVYGNVKEKDLNLDVSKRLDGLLKQAGVKTYMTRTTDTYVGLYDRSAYANSKKADLFVSIHHNAGMKKTSGSMTLYYPGAGKSGGFTGKDLAGIVQQKLVTKLHTKDLGVIPRSQLVVLRTTSMPAVIAEIGYMTNSNELERLKKASFRQEAAEALRDAVLEALKKIK